MAGVNKVILLGNLGKDPEVRTFDGGRKVAKFSLATTESYKDKTTGQRVDSTEWHNVEFWGPVAEVCERFLKKGSKIYVEGKIRTNSYDDKDGIKRYATNIIGDSMTMLDSKPQDGQNNGYNPAPAADNNTSTSQSNFSQPVAPSIASTSDVDDLPF